MVAQLLESTTSWIPTTLLGNIPMRSSLPTLEWCLCQDQLAWVWLSKGNPSELDLEVAFLDAKCPKLLWMQLVQHANHRIYCPLPNLQFLQWELQQFPTWWCQRLSRWFAKSYLVYPHHLLAGHRLCWIQIVEAMHEGPWLWLHNEIEH